MKKIKLITLMLIVILITSCGTKDNNELEGFKFTETSEVTNYVKIEMKNGNKILLKLYPDTAPITVANFQKLVSEKFYDGTIFHRVIKDFMIQTGISATGKEAENIKGEFEINGVKNDLKHTRGIISMARTNLDYDSASSQFFIMHKDYPSLNGKYAAFGKVIAGLSTVDTIANIQTNNERPTTDQTIKSIRFIEIEEN